MLVGSGAYDTLDAVEESILGAFLSAWKALCCMLVTMKSCRIVSAKVEMKYELLQSLQFLVLTKLQ